MPSNELATWPAGLTTREKEATLLRTRLNAAGKIVKSLSPEHPFAVTPELKNSTHLAVARIARLPREVDHLYQLLLTSRAVTMLVAGMVTKNELEREIPRQCERSLGDLFYEIEGKHQHYRFLMSQTIDRALQGVLESSSKPMDEYHRLLITWYLEVTSRNEQLGFHY